MTHLGLSILAALVAVTSIVFYAPDADAVYAVYDVVWFARHAEQIPWSSVVGHHPLYHVLLNVLVPPLRALGAADPGMAACRVLSAASFVAVIAGFRVLAGRSRAGAALGFAALFIGMRSVLLEGFTGGNILPAAAGAVWLLAAAAAERPRPAWLGLAIVVALLLRQDNLLLLPGALLLAARPGRARDLAKTVALSGAVTLAAYAALWPAGRPGASLREFLLDLAVMPERTTWAPPRAPSLADAELRFEALGAAVTGVLTDRIVMHAFIAGAFLAVAAVAARAWRGGRAAPRLLPATLLVLGIQLAFYAWFEPHNPKWWVVSMAWTLGAATRAARGEPRTGPVPRRTAGAVLAAAVVATLAVHLPNLVELSAHQLARSTRDAQALAASLGTDRFFANLSSSSLFLPASFQAGVGAPIEHLPGGVGEIMARFEAAWRTDRRPFVYLADRFVRDGHPHRLVRDEPGALLDALPASPRLVPARVDGRVVALGVLPPP